MFSFWRSAPLISEHNSALKVDLSKLTAAPVAVRYG